MVIFYYLDSQFYFYLWSTNAYYIPWSTEERNGE